jgi:trk system potassium uptake protein TrkA
VARSTDQLLVGDLAYVICQRDHTRRTLGLFGHEEQEAGRLVIAGGGNIGYYVARAIEDVQPKTKVKIIESDAERAVMVSDKLSNSIVLHGSALDQNILQQAEIQDADLMVTLTNSDQTNILSAAMAKRMGCKAGMVLINNPSFQDLTHAIGIDHHINPRAVTISRVLQHVRKGRIRSVYAVQKGMAEVIEAEALETSPLVGVAFRDLHLPPGIRIGAIYRDGTVLRPNGDLKIKAKDRVVLFAAAAAVRDVEQMFRVSIQYF